MPGLGNSPAEVEAGSDSHLTGFDPDQALPVAWYDRPVEEVARDLLGCVIVSTVDDLPVVAWIVETEAYGDQSDPASHASFRGNGLVRAMWGEPGKLYVYRAYGVYPCLNVVTGPAGQPSAVLLRAAALLLGHDQAMDRLGKHRAGKPVSGPGLLGRALAGDVSLNGSSLDRPPIWIQSGRRPARVISGPRIGISRGTDRLWRFGVAGHPALSRPFPAAG